MKPKAPARPTPLARPIQAAMSKSPAVRAALARLRPAERAQVNKAVAAALTARLRREGWSE
ncbi:MAG TPA: hypothetical protein VNU97_07545 [Rhizomicrobium sp.]|nr:hypothetical protein [Rhizomicrobium sp.]